MKKVIILFAVLTAFAVNSFAQTNTQAAVDKPAMAGQKPESWKTVLDLTKEQDMKMKEIGKAYKEKSDALKADASMDKKVKKEKMMELQAANDTDLKAVLSADQFAKYIEVKKQRNDLKKAQQAAEAPKND